RRRHGWRADSRAGAVGAGRRGATALLRALPSAHPGDRANLRARPRRRNRAAVRPRSKDLAFLPRAAPRGHRSGRTGKRKLVSPLGGGATRSPPLRHGDAGPPVVARRGHGGVPRGADGESWLMEINPRLWGSVALPIDAGVDFPAGLLLLATAQAVPPQPGYRVPYYTRR